MKALIISGAAALSLFLSVQSCSKEKVSDYADMTCAGDTISFASQIQPLVNQNCSTSGCHDATASGGYNFTTHSSIASNASMMLKAMRAEGGVQLMPQGGPQLADSLIHQFSCWIQQGKMDN